MQIAYYIVWALVLIPILLYYIGVRPAVCEQLSINTYILHTVIVAITILGLYLSIRLVDFKCIAPRPVVERKYTCLCSFRLLLVFAIIIGGYVGYYFLQIPSCIYCSFAAMVGMLFVYPNQGEFEKLQS